MTALDEALKTIAYLCDRLDEVKRLLLYDGVAAVSIREDGVTTAVAHIDDMTRHGRKMVAELSRGARS